MRGAKLVIILSYSTSVSEMMFFIIKNNQEILLNRVDFTLQARTTTRQFNGHYFLGMV